MHESHAFRGAKMWTEKPVRKTVNVGGTLEEAAARVARAWQAAEAGEPFEAQDNVTFLSWSALSSVMTDGRYAMLRHLHEHPAPSIRALARALGRDFKRVHQDVAALESVGLIEREDGALCANYDEIRASILLDAPAA